MITVGLALFLCAVWAVTLRTNLGTVAELAPGDSTRIQHEEVERALGPGWFAPIEVIADAEQGPVTTPSRIKALTAFQRGLERTPASAR